MTIAYDHFLEENGDEDELPEDLEGLENPDATDDLGITVIEVQEGKMRKAQDRLLTDARSSSATLSDPLGDADQLMRDLKK